MSRASTRRLPWLALACVVVAAGLFGLVLRKDKDIPYLPVSITQNNDDIVPVEFRLIGQERISHARGHADDPVFGHSGKNAYRFTGRIVIDGQSFPISVDDCKPRLVVE